MTTTTISSRTRNPWLEVRTRRFRRDATPRMSRLQPLLECANCDLGCWSLIRKYACNLLGGESPKSQPNDAEKSGLTFRWLCDLSRKTRRAPAQAARRSVASQPQRRLVASLKTRVPTCLAIVHRWTPTSLSSETIAEEIPSKSRVYLIISHAIHQAREAP